MNDEGYEFTPLPPTVRRVARDEARHDRAVPGAITATIDLRLVAEQPIHIGSGFKTLCDGAIVRAAMTSGGIPCVPGSSLKGVIRARFEAITKSCALFRAKDRATKIRSSSYPGARARLDENVVRGPHFQTCGDRGICPACALFGFASDSRGRVSLRSRVAVSDFVVDGDVRFAVAEVAEMFSPNLHHVGSFVERSERGDQVLVVTRLHGRKFARGRGPEMPSRERIEVIPRGASLSGQIRVSNVGAAEYGGLLAALGVAPLSRVKIGGGKGHRFGRVRIELAKVTPRPASVAVESAPDTYTQRFLASDDAWRAGLDALVHIHAAEREP